MVSDAGIVHFTTHFLYIKDQQSLNCQFEAKFLCKIAYLFRNTQTAT
jgi:hypothetical protein